MEYKDKEYKSIIKDNIEQKTDTSEVRNIDINKLIR